VKCLQNLRETNSGVMKTSAVAAGKRRSMLPSPKTEIVGGTAGVTASKTCVVAAEKNRDSAAMRSRALPEVKRVVGVGSKRSSSVNESRLKPSSLQQSAVANKRPSSASITVRRDLNHSSKTSQDFCNSVKLSSVKDDADEDAKRHRLSRATTSVISSRSAGSFAKQRKLPALPERKLKIPAKHVRNNAAVDESCSQETVSATVSYDSQAETLPDISTSLLTESLEDVVGETALPECGSSNAAEAVEHERDCSGAPDVLSKVPANVHTELRTSSSTSLGILNESELFNNSLLSFDCSSATSAADMSEAEPVHSTDLLTESPEGDAFGTTYIVPECGFSDSVECLESVSLAPDVVSKVRAIADSELRTSSRTSLGILNDSELLNNSLLSFDCSSALMNEVEAVHHQANDDDDDDDDDTVLAVELRCKQYASASSSDELNLRPVSLMSSDSCDVGIVADCTVHLNECQTQQHRPSSYMSTSSADTGMSQLIS